MLSVWLMIPSNPLVLQVFHRFPKEVAKKVRKKGNYLTVLPKNFYQSATFNHCLIC